MLLAAGYDPPHQLFVHGYLLLDDRKISKSLGNAVDPLDLLDVYGTDPVRFWCARAVSFGQDGAASLVGHPRALRARARQRPRQPALADDRDGRPLSRRHASCRSVARRRGRRGARRRLRDDVAARLDAFDITGALERIWEVVRALNREVETTAPWQLAKDEARAEELDRVLYDLVDGLRAVAIALSAYLPETATAILAALGQPKPSTGRSSRTASRARPRGSKRLRRSSPASTSPRRDRPRVIDTHAHLDGCEEPAAFLVERARAVGVTRIVTIGTGIESCRAALAIAEAQEGVYAAVGIDPHQAGGAEAARLDELDDAARAPVRGRGRGDRARLLP